MDLNCDLGEGLGNEHLLMPFISSCNIACGGHAGSVDIMDRVIGLAIENNVKIGAHPSFEDKVNFGRVILNISNGELMQSLTRQMELFKERAALQNTTVHHVKPHGALYHLITVSQEKAMVVVEAIQQVFGNLTMFVPYGSAIEVVAKGSGLTILYEVFADRNYQDNLTLVSRKETNAILTSPEEIIQHVLSMEKKSQVKTISGAMKMIKAETFCVHGDNQNVIPILQRLNEEFSID